MKICDINSCIEWTWTPWEVLSVHFRQARALEGRQGHRWQKAKEARNKLIKKDGANIMMLKDENIITLVKLEHTRTANSLQPRSRLVRRARWAMLSGKYFNWFSRNSRTSSAIKLKSKENYRFAFKVATVFINNKFMKQNISGEWRRRTRKERMDKKH